MFMDKSFTSCRFSVYPLFPFSITSFRCSDTLVVAYTELRDALVWGLCRDNVVIKVPQIGHLEFPRDFFSNGAWKDTGSSVNPGMYLVAIFISFITNELIWNSRKDRVIVTQISIWVRWMVVVVLRHVLYLYMNRCWHLLLKTYAAMSIESDKQSRYWLINRCSAMVNRFHVFNYDHRIELMDEDVCVFG